MRSLCLIAGMVIAFISMASCGSGDRASFEEEDPTSPLGRDGGGNGFESDGSGQSGLGCSSDLHHVIDADGRLLETCPSDQGCADGRCVPACESADRNQSTIGCSYYVAPPDTLPIAHGACFAAFVANTWGVPIKLGVERAGQKLDVGGMARIPSGSGLGITYAPLVNDEVPPGQVAIVFLSRNGSNLTSCPDGVTPGLTAIPASVAGTGRGDAFHITTTAPVVAYDIFPYGGGASAATSATLLLPTSAWGSNYVGVNAYRKSVYVAAAEPSLQIVAREDDTEIKILPRADIRGGASVASTPANQTGVYTLNRGQFLQFTQPVELTGSAIEANKPVGVFGGSMCISIDVGAQACDTAHQQLPPVKAMGTRYVGVRYRNRYDGIEEAPPWRVVGAVDGTQLTYEPSAPPGAPTTLSFGQVAEFTAPGPFVVKSQDDGHPFYVSAHMTGCFTFNNQFDCRGDPEFVNVIPPEQYLKSYVFFTDPTYPETNLVVVRRKTSGAFSDVTLDCAGALSGWQPIGTGGEFEMTRVDLVRGNFEKQGGCDNGRHEMKSEGTFGLTVWGWGSAATGVFSSQAVSYAYPAGASVKPVNNVIVPTGPR